MSRVGDIEEAKVIDEETLPLSGNGNGSTWIQWLAKQADNITSGNRGGWVTEALILADLTDNEEQLKSAYQANKQAIDRYFEQVDVEKIINDAGPGIQKRLQKGITETVKNNVPGFLAGTIVAAGSIIAIKKYRDSND